MDRPECEQACGDLLESMVLTVEANGSLASYDEAKDILKQSEIQHNLPITHELLLSLQLQSASRLNECRADHSCRWLEGLCIWITCPHLQQLYE